jgi:hypothetical protein
MRQANILLAAALVAAGAAAYAGDEYEELAAPQAGAAVSSDGVVIAETPTDLSESITVEQRRVIDAVLKIPPQAEGSV